VSTWFLVIGFFGAAAHLPPTIEGPLTYDECVTQGKKFEAGEKRDASWICTESPLADWDGT
jgi:hypothetical protein